VGSIFHLPVAPTVVVVSDSKMTSRVTVSPGVPVPFAVMVAVRRVAPDLGNVTENVLDRGLRVTDAFGRSPVVELDAFAWVATTVPSTVGRRPGKLVEVTASVGLTPSTSVGEVVGAAATIAVDEPASCGSVLDTSSTATTVSIEHMKNSVPQPIAMIS